MSCEQDCPYIAWLDGRLGEIDARRTDSTAYVAERMAAWEELESGDIVREASLEVHGEVADEEFVQEVLESIQPALDALKRSVGITSEEYLSSLDERSRRYENQKAAALADCPGPVRRQRLERIGRVGIACGNAEASGPYVRLYEQ